MPVKFKKGSKEAKAHMAKIRAMRGAGAGKHTDTKSHNVNIKVVSGTKAKSTTRQTGTSNIEKDFSKKAKAPGKRKSATGKTYYERRANRSDKPGSLLGILSGNIYNVRDSLERDISKNLEQLKRIKSYKQSAMTKKAITHIANHIVLLKKQLREQNKLINQSFK